MSIHPPRNNLERDRMAELFPHRSTYSTTTPQPNSEASLDSGRGEAACVQPIGSGSPIWDASGGYVPPVAKPAPSAAPLPDREAIARAIIGPRLPVPTTSRSSLSHLQQVRWANASNAERQDALNAADAILALFPTPAPSVLPSDASVEERAREVAHRIVREFRSGGWPAKEDEIARLLVRNFAREAHPPQSAETLSQRQAREVINPEERAREGQTRVPDAIQVAKTREWLSAALAPHEYATLGNVSLLPNVIRAMLAFAREAPSPQSASDRHIPGDLRCVPPQSAANLPGTPGPGANERTLSVEPIATTENAAYRAGLEAAAKYMDRRADAVGSAGSNVSTQAMMRAIFAAEATAIRTLPTAQQATVEAAKVERDVQFEVWQDDMLVAASTDEADARHYLAVYGQDGPVKLMRAETVRTPLAALTASSSQEGEG